MISNLWHMGRQFKVLKTDVVAAEWYLQLSQFPLLASANSYLSVPLCKMGILQLHREDVKE